MPKTSYLHRNQGVSRTTIRSSAFLSPLAYVYALLIWHVRGRVWSRLLRRIGADGMPISIGESLV